MGACHIAFAVALLLALGAACAPTPAPTPTPTATPIPEVALGDYLEGGAYALPGGAWIFDVPDGMRLWHSLGGGTPSAEHGVNYGFKDVVTGSLLTLYVLPGGSEVEFYGFNHGETPAARELATAWLAAVEASVRRPPGYVEPAVASGASGAADPGPGTNSDGVPYLRDYDHSGEVFEGGRTYATPDGDWLIDAPAGMRFIFHDDVFTPSGDEFYYWFQEFETVRSVIIDKETGEAFNSESVLLDTLAGSIRMAGPRQ